MRFTRRELIQFLDRLVELSSQENKVKEVLAKKFLSDFEKTYGYERELPVCLNTIYSRNSQQG